MSFIIGVEWASTLIIMLLSIIRSWNIGYQRETYLLGIFLQLPLIYNGIRLNDTRLILMNTFYFVNGIIAVYCWSLSSDKLSENPLRKL